MSDTNYECEQELGQQLTYGSPRQHIWSFAGGFNENNPKCPCSSNSGSCAISSIIGNDYFCESGTSQYDRQDAVAAQNHGFVKH